MSLARDMVVAAILLFGIVLGAICEGASPDAKTSSPDVVVAERIVIDKIWSSVRVGFCLLTHGDMQYVGYFNSERRMVIGMRRLGEAGFTKRVLPSESDKPPRESAVTSTIQGWDSHNYITMAVDKEGCIHLSGNMHVDPLVYFRSEQPRDITTMKQVRSMVGKNEARCTYPKFMEGPGGNLLFHYRDGSSGNGNEIYNIYDNQTKKWRRFLEKPLIDGRGKMNAYQNGPMLGPDGWYHLLWVWRDTADAATNHDLSYARSRDLINWENAAGKPLALPITFESKGVIVDPIPVRGGIINGCHHMGFDSRNRLVVSYHKHDENGNTQAYAARFGEGKWLISKVSDWHGKHQFEGGGSGPSTFGTSLSVNPVKPSGKGKLELPYSHWKEGGGILIIDEDTLKPLRAESAASKPALYPRALSRPVSGFPGMQVRWTADSGKSPDPAFRYVLRCETLGNNRDAPREGDLPENSDLVLFKIGQSGD